MAVAGETDSKPRNSTTRILIIVAAAVAMVLFGAALGMLIRVPLNDQSPVPGTGSVDVGFAQDMSTHHLQAVTMANWARDHTDDSQIRQLAFDIESTQLEQVGRMKGWLTLWGQPEQSPTGKYMGWMADSAGHSMPGMTSAVPAGGVDTMPGYASAAEISKLESLSGKDMDIYFLQLMLRHHEGGAPMAEYAAAHASVSAVRTLAENMLTSQATEMTTMTQLLSARGAKPLPLSQ